MEKGRIPNDGFTHVGDELVHQGWVVGFHVRTVESPDGQRHLRDTVTHPGAVAVVALDEDDHVYLVQQYRAAIDADLIEIPAGKCDVAGEPPIETARRELEEEIGRRPARLEPLINVHYSPGFCDEYGHLFLATELTPVEFRREGPEEEAMQIHRVPVAEAVRWCLEGRITDAKSVAGLLAVAMIRGVSTAPVPASALTAAGSVEGGSDG